MWSLRRASYPLKRQGYWLGDSRAFAATFDIVTVKGDTANICKPTKWSSDRCLSSNEFIKIQRACENFSIGRFSFCSQAGAESSSQSDKDLEEGFSELGTPTKTENIEDTNAEDEDGEDLVSAPELSDDDMTKTSRNDIDLSDIDMGVTGVDSQTKKVYLELFNAIVAAPDRSTHSALNKWVEEGKDLERAELNRTIITLRKHRMYWKALELLEWLETTKRLDFTEREYTLKLDLIAKLHGLHNAERYIENIPKSFRGGLVYRSLLFNSVTLMNMKKAEDVFIKMRKLELPLTIFACNQMILLYKRLDKRKIPDIILLMEKENIKPSLLTYKLLIDIKGEVNDIKGMDQIVERMKEEGIEPDIQMLSTLVKYYLSAGLKDKAESVLEEIELGYKNGSDGARKALFGIYAALGKADEVGKIWEACELKPKIAECMSAIEAWGKLGKIEEAEAVFEKMQTQGWKLSSRHYSALLRVYVNNKLLTKGKEFVNRMEESGSWVGPLTWDAIVRLYIEAGDVDKADSILQKAVQRTRVRPMFVSYMVVMDQYAKRGDVHNAEKLLYLMRRCGYNRRLRPFEVLLQAYINAKTPAYGFRERMKAENVYPNKSFAKQLAQANPFRQTAVSDLLD